MSTRKPSVASDVRVYISESRRVHIETPFSRVSLSPEEFLSRLRTRAGRPSSLRLVR
jgi:hypothetical protein